MENFLLTKPPNGKLTPWTREGALGICLRLGFESMRPYARLSGFAALAFVLSLGGCSGGQDAQNNALASLDTRLTNGAAVAPVANATQDDRKDADAQGPTLGDLAEAQRPGRTPEAVTKVASASGRPVGGCVGRGLRYGDEWAQAMPDGLGLYPGARLAEAAGSDTGRCRLRVISFTTGDAPEAVVAHYIEQARAAGFDAERQPCRDEIRLGGTRAGDDAAYLLFARRARGGGTEVDIIASAGPNLS